MASIAIIGTGISGLAAAYLLHPRHDITVYEKAPTVGGHARTLTIRYDGSDIAVDTGFIVFNYRNYPHLSALFKHLNVPVRKSTMSFGVTADGGSLEWSAQSPNALFGQRRNLVRPAFWRFLIDVVRFNRGARAAVLRYPGLTLGQLIGRLGLGDWFARYYLLPMGGAIWSCPLAAMLDFPAKTFVDFFDAHGLLTVTQQPQWYTVTGGSRQYLAKLADPFKSRIRTGCAALSVTRVDGKIELRDARGDSARYDHVVLAGHADESLALLTDATAEERAALGAFRYQKNTAVLHRDVTVMPKRRRCWASWIYHAEQSAAPGSIAVTYWMNKLQSIDENSPLFVTLNPLREIPAAKTFDTHVFYHPVYSEESVAAQGRLASLQGGNGTWFCGAYLRNGFHEDGIASAVSVATRLGAEVPWH